MSETQDATANGLNVQIDRRIAETLGRSIMERIVVETRAQHLSDQLEQAYDGLRQAGADLEAAKGLAAERDEARAEAERLGQQLKAARAQPARPRR